MPSFVTVWADDPVDFSRDILPILSDNCFQCHGPDEESRKGELRLDQESELTRDRGGYAVVSPGDVEESELLRRILADDESEIMPPPDTGKQLTSDQIARVRQWIEQGAKWDQHWAFVAPVRPDVPEVPGYAPEAWKGHPIDAFIWQRLEAAGLSPSEQANSATLLRRLHLDLTGLPPTLEEQEAFLSETGKDAYVRMIDRLLASSAYGERWARHWLDAARYSDSDGYEKDMRRQNWHYRDWVVNAMNADMPYDQFIIEQIAGDLLPNAGQDQVIATGFLRNSMVNEEGGADPEQFRVAGLFDRMDAIGKAILGVTTQCAQCHTHKYDPLTQTEYYGMFAYLNNCNESIRAVYTSQEQQKISSLRQQVQAKEQSLRETRPDWRDEVTRWAAIARNETHDWTVLTAQRENFSGQKFAFLPDGSILSQSYAPPKTSDTFIADLPVEAVSAFRLEMLMHPDLPRGGPGRSVFGTNALTELKLTLVDPQGKRTKLEIASATSDVNVAERPLGSPFRDAGKTDKRTVGPIGAAIDGDPLTAWTTRSGIADQNQPRKAVFVLAERLGEIPPGARLSVQMQQNHGGSTGNQRNTNLAGCFRFSVTDADAPVADPLPAAVRKIVMRETSEWTDDEWHLVFRYWRTTQPDWSKTNEEIAQLLGDFPLGTDQYVVSERGAGERRATYRLTRGDFLHPAERVDPHTPAFLHPLPADAPATRLTFARWLVDRRSPTTARALVNRVWQAYFGTGIVATSEDLGLQSPNRSHPELLDWLSVELMEHDWSLKHLHRLITTSAAYRQHSQLTPELREADPHNRLLARGARIRVQAEIVRDIALAASGLLNRQLGGPTVCPPAPEFLFKPPASYGIKPWEVAERGQRYRRSLYVQSYRSVPYPPLQMFDAPNGDAACVRRARSNTPLQALTLLNEPQFVTCAQSLARRLLDMSAESDQERIETAYRLLVCRQPTSEEVATVSEFLTDCRAKCASDEFDAAAVAGASADTPTERAKNLAVWTLVSRCLLNLDETITKQ